MKAELINVPDRGLCILISDIDIQQVNDVASSVYRNSFDNSVFSDIYLIADELRNRRKIGAIKEIREQTHWGLRDAKAYIDKYIPMGINENFDYNMAADKFIKDHTIQDFILTKEMLV